MHCGTHVLFQGPTGPAGDASPPARAAAPSSPAYRLPTTRVGNAADGCMAAHGRAAVRAAMPSMRAGQMWGDACFKILAGRHGGPGRMGPLHRGHPAQEELAEWQPRAPHRACCRGSGGPPRGALPVHHRGCPGRSRPQPRLAHAFPVGMPFDVHRTAAREVPLALPGAARAVGQRLRPRVSLLQRWRSRQTPAVPGPATTPRGVPL